MTTPKKDLTFAVEDSILKSSLNRFEPQGASQVYFRLRSNKNLQKSIFKNIVFATYLKLSIPISIQQVIEFGSIEAKLLEVVTSIQKSLSKIDNKKVILAWHPKVENVLRPMKSVDLTKILSNKIVNDKYIQTLQMGPTAKYLVLES